MPSRWSTWATPHAVCFVEDPDTAPVTTDGPVVEHHADFPQRINVEFVKVENPEHLRMRVWERGTGEDAGLRHGLVRGSGGGVPQRPVRPQRGGDRLPGGTLQIEWSEDRRTRIPDGAGHLRI